ncbi:MAG: hypothetical protein Q9227_007852 [Pyrenula ochraceoflavens]
MSFTSAFSELGPGYSSISTYLLPILSICIPPLVLLFALNIRPTTQPRGCKRIGLQAPSNLLDEEDDNRYAKPAPSTTWKIKALMIHPIKSCASVEIHSADVESTGLRYDRQFAFAEWRTTQSTAPDGAKEKYQRWEFRTLRNPGYERMVLIKPEVWVPDPDQPKSNHVEYRQNMESGGVLVIRYPRFGKSFTTFLAIRLGLISPYKTFRVPLNPPAKHTYPSEQVTIWKDSPAWLNYGQHVPSDLREFLGIQNPFTLFRVDPASLREVFRCAPRKESLGYQPVIGFADAYPLHLLNLTSVRSIAAKVESDIPHFSARRFRPNLVVSGPSEFNEDRWKRVKIGKREYYCACHTVRCRLPNVDPVTAKRHPKEPDATLKRLRCIDAGDPKNACLGLQLVPAIQGGEITVGDTIEVLERGEHFYIKQ